MHIMMPAPVRHLFLKVRKLRGIFSIAAAIGSLTIR